MRSSRNSARRGFDADDRDFARKIRATLTTTDLDRAYAAVGLPRGERPLADRAIAARRGAATDVRLDRCRRCELGDADCAGAWRRRWRRHAGPFLAAGGARQVGRPRTRAWRMPRRRWPRSARNCLVNPRCAPQLTRTSRRGPAERLMSVRFPPKPSRRSICRSRRRAVPDQIDFAFRFPPPLVATVCRHLCLAQHCGGFSPSPLAGEGGRRPDEGSAPREGMFEGWTRRGCNPGSFAETGGVPSSPLRGPSPARGEGDNRQISAQSRCLYTVASCGEGRGYSSKRGGFHPHPALPISGFAQQILGGGSYSALAGVRFGSLLSSQPPPSATIRLTTAESCEKRVASRFCWSLSSVASAVTTVVKFCVPA